SNILVPDEFVFVTIFSTICIIYAAFILIVGIMRVHDYSFSKFLLTTVLSIIAMMIIVFLLFIVFMLAQQVYGFVLTLVNEITYG
ncbi:MAG: YIP1 family protein, partial [Clostridia bacterium]|nr:YIP1 family protein [Clostridia bacterium]